ncbi:MAG: M20/M25/M40 family metallo-hydrolase [Gemmatimonadales bacterium]|nr:MAG: M20/M25/M40 family metallo-hydrolase [Gemmatimonadales bacterium]
MQLSPAPPPHCIPVSDTREEQRLPPSRPDQGRLVRLGLVLLALTTGCARPAVEGPPPLQDDDTPRVERLQVLMEALAADSMAGRRAGTPGEHRAVTLLEAELARYGVQPAGSNGYRQPVPLIGMLREDGRVRWTRAPDGTLTDTLPPERLRTAYNVLGLIPGDDPDLAGEIVVVGAHHDHVGVGAAVDGDSIFNGADDDASGTVAVLEIARDLAREHAPGRTVLVAFFTAEEIGLLGTRHWIENPTVDFESVVANLQIEMIGRPDSLAGGFGRGWLTGYERSSMGDILAAQGSPIVPDPRPEMRFFFRSDNLPFAALGIPAHTLSSYNLHSQYHTPDDEVELVDYRHMAALVEAAVAMVRELTTGPTPTWKEGGREGLPGG